MVDKLKMNLCESNVLVVDDDEKVRKLLKVYLQRAGYYPVVAGNFKEALRSLKFHAFDCVICDIKMPDRDGIEVLEYIRKEYKELPVIMLTGYVDLNTAIRVMKKGAFDYLVKPIQRERLLLVVRKAIEHKRLLEENIRLEKENRLYQRDLERKVEMQTRLMVSNYRFANELNSLDSLEETLDFVLDCIRRSLRSDRISIMLLEKNDLVIKAALGLDKRTVEKTRIPIGSNVAGKVFQLRKPLLIENIEEAIGLDQRINPEYSSFMSVPLVVAPLKTSNNVIGIINVTNKSGNERYTQEDLQILSYIADAASIAINNQLNRLRLEKGYLDTIRALTLAVEAKDPYTRGHSDRVREYSVEIAKKLGLSKDEIKVLEYAGILHDIGKIGIPERIILKPSRLTEEEFAEIKKHPEIGERMVEHIEFLDTARPVIRHHHERFDGKGYPDGVGEEDIELGARIMAVADAFDAMTSSRPYRGALSREEAIAELIRASGTQLDPHCVGAFLEVLVGFKKEKQS